MAKESQPFLSFVCSYYSVRTVVTFAVIIASHVCPALIHVLAWKYYGFGFRVSEPLRRTTGWKTSGSCRAAWKNWRLSSLQRASHINAGPRFGASEVLREMGRGPGSSNSPREVRLQHSPWSALRSVKKSFARHGRRTGRWKPTRPFDSRSIRSVCILRQCETVSTRF
jgi:hypothetical protein